MFLHFNFRMNNPGCTLVKAERTSVSHDQKRTKPKVQRSSLQSHLKTEQPQCVASKLENWAAELKSKPKILMISLIPLSIHNHSRLSWTTLTATSKGQSSNSKPPVDLKIWLTEDIVCQEKAAQIQNTSWYFFLIYFIGQCQSDTLPVSDQYTKLVH